MRTSDKGVELIKHFEGYSRKPYICPAGYLTIGYGHVIKKEDAYKYIAGIGDTEAEALLRIDLMKAEDGVKRQISVALNQNQFDALVSFVFNLGEGRLKASTLRRMLNRGEYEAAANQFSRWVFADGKKLAGLIKRRDAEADLFLEPYEPKSVEIAQSPSLFKQLATILRA